MGFAAHVVGTAEMLAKQRISNQQLKATLALSSESLHSMSEGLTFESMIYSLCKHMRDLYFCDRCTFFIVDALSPNLIGWFISPETGDLQSLRVPRAGAVAIVCDTGKALNIADAWNDERFSKATDLETGYRTRTLLTEPVLDKTHRVVAVLQCINKKNNQPFNSDDTESFKQIAAMLADMWSKLRFEVSERSLLGREDVADDVKQQFRSGTYDPRCVWGISRYQQTF